MKKIITTAVVAAVLAAGCAAGDPIDGSTTGQVNMFKINGLNCVSWKAEYAGGVTCDWERWQR
jgi:hypothetical protein